MIKAQQPCQFIAILFHKDDPHQFSKRHPIGSLSAVCFSPSQSGRSNESPRFNIDLIPIVILKPTEPKPTRSFGLDCRPIFNPRMGITIGARSDRTASNATPSSTMVSPESRGSKFSNEALKYQLFQRFLNSTCSFSGPPLF